MKTNRVRQSGADHPPRSPIPALRGEWLLAMMSFASTLLGTSRRAACRDYTAARFSWAIPRIIEVDVGPDAIIGPTCDDFALTRICQRVTQQPIQVLD